MLTIDAAIRLSKFQIVRKNESSQDEPFLWILGVKFDSVTAGNVLQFPEKAKLEFHVPPGRHNNLGSAAENADNKKPIDIPDELGVWRTSLQFDPALPVPAHPVAFAPICTLAIVVAGLEEDGTTDTHAIEAHRRVMVFVRSTLTAEVHALLVEAVQAIRNGQPLPTGDDIQDRLRDTVTEAAIRSVINGLRDDVLPGAIIGGIFNFISLFGSLAEADADELVGQRIAFYSMPELIANAMDGQEIQFELNRDQNLVDLLEAGIAQIPANIRDRVRDRGLMRSKEGHYRVTGRTRRTDLREPPTIAAFWSLSRIAVFARGNERRIHHAHSSDGGETFEGWTSTGSGVLSSGAGAAASADGKRIFVFGRGTNNNIWFARSKDGVRPLKDAGWREMPKFESRYGACAAMSEAAKRLHVFAVSPDHRVHWSWSNDGGDSWNLPWGFVGQGLLDSSPAAAVSPDGKQLNIFGVGTDRNIWRAASPDGGINWTHLWSRSGLPDRPFLSAPACAMSADGQRLFLIGKSGRNYFFLRSEDGGAQWHEREWVRMGRHPGDGFFISAPAICASPDLKEVHIFGVFSDMRLYHRVLRDGVDGGPWAPIGLEAFA